MVRPLAWMMRDGWQGVGISVPSQSSWFMAKGERGGGGYCTLARIKDLLINDK